MRGKDLPSTLLMSPAPKPVKVRLCLGRVTPEGPMGPLRSVIGAPVEGRRWRGLDIVIARSGWRL